MSDRDPPVLSLEQWASDLAAVCEAAQPQEPFTLLGISQGAHACVQYAVQHPERVKRMILYGGSARGFRHRGSPDTQREYGLILEAMRIGWGKENPIFRQLFTSRFIPEGTAEQLAWFNELCRRTADPEMAAMRATSSPLAAVHSGMHSPTYLTDPSSAHMHSAKGRSLSGPGHRL